MIWQSTNTDENYLRMKEKKRKEGRRETYHYDVEILLIN